MSRLFKSLMVAAAMLLSSVVANAQINGFGVVGGVTSSVTRFAKPFDVKSISVYHLGITNKFNLGLGLAVQPSLLYQMKGASLDYLLEGDVAVKNAVSATVGYVEVPVQIQWGPDMLAFRPYLFMEPFIGFNVNTKTESNSAFAAVEAVLNDSGIRKWEYGLGLGAGLEIWRFQFSARYFWNFGKLCNDNGDISTAIIGANSRGSFGDWKSFNGLTFSLAFLFGNNR